ncbi:Class I SAM-dependent methyltransferase [uncultured Gammaproteobacteria bacterium]
MILEALEYLVTPCPPWARRLGFLTEAVSLRARHHRCRQAWAGHVAECRRLVLDAAELCNHRRSVAILGSGLLIEIPLAELARRFERVVLIDAVHPWPTRWQSWRWDTVELLTRDLTGVGEALITALRTTPFLPLPRPYPPRLPGMPFDLVVSANLLSQLPVLPLDYLETRDTAGHFSTRDRELFADSLVRSHLSWLPSMAEVACLFSDIRSVVRDGTREGTAESVLPGVALPTPDRTWSWDIAPHPEQHPRFDRRNTVAGYLTLAGMAEAPASTLLGTNAA